VQTSFLIGN